MVDLQDAANLAIVLGLIAAVIINVLQYVYGPRAKRREELQEVRAKLVRELRNARSAARSPKMDAYIGHLRTWEEHGHRLPRRVRREVQAFDDLCASYWSAYEDAEKRVKLAVYESVAARPTLPRLPKADEGQEPHWIIQGPSKGRTSKDSLDAAMIGILEKPLLRGETVTWSWLTDRELEFVDQLKEVTDEASITPLLEDIGRRLEYRPEELDRPGQIKAKIRDFRFRHLSAANEA